MINVYTLKRLVPFQRTGAMASANPRFTLVYDDLSWGAADLQLVQSEVPDENHIIDFTDDFGPYAYKKDGVKQRDIRRRFGKAVEAFVGLVSRMKKGHVHPRLHGESLGIPFDVNLVALSDFIDTYRFDDSKTINHLSSISHLFVSLYFVDVVGAKELSVGLYSSPKTVARVREWNAKTIGANSTFTTDPVSIEYNKALSRTASLALVDAQVDMFSDRQVNSLRGLVQGWLGLESAKVRASVAQKLGRARVDHVSLHTDVFFVDTKNSMCIETNLESISTAMHALKLVSRNHRSNVTEADTLQQIIEEGITGDPESSDWSKFLTKGLYDPRVFLHVWHMIKPSD